jgi:hypothetical protein
MIVPNRTLNPSYPSGMRRVSVYIHSYLCRCVILLDMKDLLIIFGMIIVVIAVGAALFFFGPSSFRSYLAMGSSPTVTFRVLARGNDADSMTQRANYEITTPAQMSELWGDIGATPGTAPNIDFTKEEVLAIFDGTHTTSGYSIAVSDITDSGTTRTVNVIRTSPGTGCSIAPGITAPYQIIAVPISSDTLTHTDTTTTQNC